MSLTFCPGNSRHLAKILSNMIFKYKIVKYNVKKMYKKIESEFNTKKMGQKFALVIGELEVNMHIIHTVSSTEVLSSGITHCVNELSFGFE